jgi:hypothetical protein
MFLVARDFADFAAQSRGELADDAASPRVSDDAAPWRAEVNACLFRQ